MISVCPDEISTLSSRDRFYLMITWGSLFRQSGTIFQLIIFQICLHFLNNPLQACAKLLFHGNNYMRKLRRGIAKEGSYLAGAKRFTCNCSIEFKNPSNFFVVYFTLEILDKTKLHPWKLHKVVLHPLEIPEPKPKNPLKFHMILS